MLEIFYQLNKPCIYSSTVWDILRKKHRIVGTFLGSSLKTPTLPVELLPEEAILLIQKGICKLTSYTSLEDEPKGHVEKYDVLQKNLLTAEQNLHKETRRDELENIIDKIIDGKKKKGISISLTKSEYLEDELNKSCTITDANMIWPIFTVSPFSYGVAKDSFSLIAKQTTHVKCAVYKDLWEKGFYITSGAKFGGDFLVYLGDPLAYHAVYIIRCVENPDVMQHTSEIVAFGRLGSSVKKKAVLASVGTDGCTFYVTLNWLYA